MEISLHTVALSLPHSYLFYRCLLYFVYPLSQVPAGNRDIHTAKHCKKNYRKIKGTHVDRKTIKGAFWSQTYTFADQSSRFIVNQPITISATLLPQTFPLLPEQHFKKGCNWSLCRLLNGDYLKCPDLQNTVETRVRTSYQSLTMLSQEVRSWEAPGY